MALNRLRRATALGLFASTALASAAWAHTTSIGFENAGPGSVTFWFGSYHGGTTYNEGSLNLTGPGIDSTVLFDQLSQVKPLGLIDGTTNFYTDSGNPPSLIGVDPGIAGGPSVWQGSTFSGLQAGTYTFTYIPIANPTAEWDPWDDAILSSMVVLSGAVVGGGNDAGIMAAESGIALTEARASGLRQVVRANSGARHAAAETQGENAIVMSKNGPSNSNFSVWARIGGGVVNADFGGDLDISHFLGQAGVEMGFNENFAAGASFGGGLTSADAGSEHLDSEALFIQPYVAYVDGGLTVVGTVAYTNVDYDDSTDILDGGDRFTGTLSGAYAVALDENTSAGPFGFLAIGKEELKGTSEDIDFVIAHAGVELSRSMELLNTGTLNVYGSVAAEYVTADAPEPAATLTDYDDDRFGGRVEVGFDFTIAGTSTQFFASAIGSGLGTDAPGASGKIGLKIPF